MFNPIRPVEVVDHHLLAPLPGALGGFRIYFHAGYMAAALLQMAADKAIGTSEFKDFASLGSQVKEDAIAAMRIVEHRFVVITVSQGAGCRSHAVMLNAIVTDGEAVSSVSLVNCHMQQVETAAGARV